MKKTLIILLATLCWTVAFGQGKYKATIGIPIYNKPTTYSFGTYIDSGSIFDLGTKTGKFWQVTYKDKVRYMPQDWKKYCIPADSVIPMKPSTNIKPIDKSNHSIHELNAKPIENKEFSTTIKPIEKPDYSADINYIRSKLSGMTSGGAELYRAGKLLLTSVGVGIGGGVLSYVLMTKADDPTLGIVCGVGTGIVTLALQIAGYRKLMKAGERFNLGATSSGIGMTINLN